MRRILAFGTVLLMMSPLATAAEFVFDDPSGDDDGPGSYTYPTAPEYKKGSFDLTKLEVKDAGDKVEIKVYLKNPIEDPWKSRDWPVKGNGFSLQMAVLFVDQDHKAGAGHDQGIPGFNVAFPEDGRWEKAVIISPQGETRLRSEINDKAKDLKADLVVPQKVSVSGKKIIAVVSKKDLGTPAAGWGFQLVVQSNEGYPDKADLLTRKVNASAGEHRFGGGRDDDCDPHVIDILAGQAKGDKGEIEAQHKALSAYSCEGGPAAWKRAVLPMIYR
ncbi:MAG: hypothetical protein GYA21_14070 [Myxococcales bacterium]|nr:hypothetical protein [Myxococcales bacterium]